jgi:hypothetical protein
MMPQTPELRTRAPRTRKPATNGRRSAKSECGATLIEALIAISIVVSTITGIAQLLVWVRRAIWSSGAGTMTTVLAVEKLEQLRALKFDIDDGGAAVTDESTDVSGQQPVAGGSGLRTSPLNALEENTSGCVDFLDAQGNWRGTGVDPPAGAAFVRRWTIVPFAPDPMNTLALHVVVVPLSDVASGQGSRSARAAHLATIRTRGVE